MADKRKPTYVFSLLLFTTVALTAVAVILAIRPVSDVLASSKHEQAVKTSTRRPATVDVADPNQSALVSAPKALTPSDSPNQVLGVASVVLAPSATPVKRPKTITYVVKTGDTLAGIAEWFHEQGFGSIYHANRAVIGKNPDLIFPGQKIVISGHSMTLVSR